MGTWDMLQGHAVGTQDTLRHIMEGFRTWHRTLTWEMLGWWPAQWGCPRHKESRTSSKAKPELQQGRGRGELPAHRPLDPGEAERRR